MADPAARLARFKRHDGGGGRGGADDARVGLHASGVDKRSKQHVSQWRAGPKSPPSQLQLTGKDHLVYQ